MYSKIQKLLDKRGIKAFRMCKDTNIPPSTVNEWKHGRSNPKVDKLMILSDYFGVPLDYFLK